MRFFYANREMREATNISIVQDKAPERAVDFQEINGSYFRLFAYHYKPFYHDIVRIGEPWRNIISYLFELSFY